MSNGSDAGTSLVGLFVWIILIGCFILVRRRAKRRTTTPPAIGGPLPAPTSSPGGWRGTGQAGGVSRASGYGISADPGTSATDNRRGGNSSDDGSYSAFYTAYYGGSSSHHDAGHSHDSGYSDPGHHHF
jgi:hypothetical protein